LNLRDISYGFWDSNKKSQIIMEQSDKRQKNREREVWVNKLIKRRLKKMNILIDR
jgi:hypothetical protein